MNKKIPNTEPFFPELETERLQLRQLTMGDLNFVYGHFSDPRVAEFLLDEPPISNISQEREIIEFYNHYEHKNLNSRWI
jgi:RimJ/RimL family protein N-acetyltransferase